MGLVDGLPAGLLGNIIIELTDPTPDAVDETTVQAYYAVDPQTTDLGAAALGRSALSRLQTVSFPKRVSLLHSSFADPSINLGRNPALKLLGFLEDAIDQIENGRTMPQPDPARATQNSQTMAKLEAMDEQTIGNWMRQWGV